MMLAEEPHPEYRICVHRGGLLVLVISSTIDHMRYEPPTIAEFTPEPVILMGIPKCYAEAFMEFPDIPQSGYYQNRFTHPVQSSRPLAYKARDNA